MPNRAFQLAATTIGGSSLEGAGLVWYAALTGGDLPPGCDFARFTAATIAAGGAHGDPVRGAWAEVGVVPATGPSGSGPGGGSAPGSGADVLRVSRSGGFAGMTTTADVDLASGDPEVGEIRALVARVDLSSVPGGPPKPDMFVYTFQVGDAEPVHVPQQHLTPDLDELARRVLGH